MIKNKTEELVRNLLREFKGDNGYSLGEDAPKPEAKTKEDPKQDGGEEPKKSNLKGKHDAVKGLLQNNVFNHAGVIEELWGDSEASNRSLFRKKLNRELNDNGVPYEFDDKELAKIVNILMDTSSKITKELKG